MLTELFLEPLAARMPWARRPAVAMSPELLIVIGLKGKAIAL
jgi:hypothetical protein